MSVYLPPPAGDQAGSTDVRFSLRSLLIATVLVAVVASVLGQVFRNVAPAERTRVIAQWGICAAFVGLFIGNHMRNRYRLERDAGRKLLELSPRVRYLPSGKSWTRFVGGAFLIALGPLYLLLVVNAPLQPKMPMGLQFWSYFFPGFLSAGAISGGVAQVWWNRAVQLRENGALYGLRLLRWDHVTNFRWESELLHLEGVDQRHNDVRFTGVVPADIREAVETVLVERLNRTAKVPGLPSLPVALPDGVTEPAVRLSTRRELVTRGCLVFLVVYAIGFIVVGLSFRNQSREYTQGLVAGFVVGAVVARLRASKHGQAGSPRIRLDLSFDWAVLLLIAASAATCYGVSQWLAFAAPWLLRCLGFGSGAAIFSLIGLVARDKLDLCDHGIVIRHWLYWPWLGTRLLRWNRDGQERIVLSRGWRRVIAKVPPEQREALDALLKEKLSYSSVRSSGDDTAV